MMKTHMWEVDKAVDKLLTYPQILEAAQQLKNGEVVALPTETVYGLGGNAKSDEAVRKIFAAKGRPGDNPLIIHVSSPAQLDNFVENTTEAARKLMDAFWPGPLTLVLPKKPGSLSDVATAGLDTVAVRMPGHPVALALIEAAGLPIAAPSANLSGKPSPTTAGHVYEDLAGKIAGIIDAGPTGVGLESTVVDCTGEVPVILRPGGITREQIAEVAGEASVDPALSDPEAAPKSPGMKYRHYAPNAPLYLVDGTKEDIQKLVDRDREAGMKVGVMTTAELEDFYKADAIFACGSRTALETVAESLYSTLRAFNESGVDRIYGEIFPDKGVGEAIMNRLTKASGYPVLKGESRAQ